MHYITGLLSVGNQTDQLRVQAEYNRVGNFEHCMLCPGYHTRHILQICSNIDWFQKFLKGPEDSV